MFKSCCYKVLPLKWTSHYIKWRINFMKLLQIQNHAHSGQSSSFLLKTLLYLKGLLYLNSFHRNNIRPCISQWNIANRSSCRPCWGLEPRSNLKVERWVIRVLFMRKLTEMVVVGTIFWEQTKYVQRDQEENTEKSGSRNPMSIVLYKSFSKSQETPLHIAARVKDGEKCAEMLVKSGADVNATKENGETALHIGARAGQIKMVKALLEEAADPSWQSKVRHKSLAALFDFERATLSKTNAQALQSVKVRFFIIFFSFQGWRNAITYRSEVLSLGSSRRAIEVRFPRTFPIWRCTSGQHTELGKLVLGMKSLNQIFRISTYIMTMIYSLFTLTKYLFFVASGRGDRCSLWRRIDQNSSS